MNQNNLLLDAAGKILTVAGIALLAGCGGGGGGGGGGFSGSTPASQYIKAFNTEQRPEDCERVPDPNPAKFDGCDQFGSAVALNADGNLLVAGAPFEDNNLGGVNPVSYGNDALGYNSGAIYTYVRASTPDAKWAKGDYIKAELPGASDLFGDVLALSDDGSTLAVGVPEEDSGETGVHQSGNPGNQADNSKNAAGAVYIFVRASGTWTPQAYIKSPASNANGRFGLSVALSADGNRLAVGEEECLGKVDGCVYVYTRVGLTWNGPAVLQASNAGAGDRFGAAVALSDSGNTLAVGAPREDSDGSGQLNDAATDAGAAYVYFFASSAWSQKSYVKPIVVTDDSNFGASVSLSESDAKTKLAVGAPREDTAGKLDSGAAYIYPVAAGVVDQLQEITALATVSSPGDQFGSVVALTGDGSSLFVAASLEDGRATNLNGDATNFWNNIDPTAGAGAAYKFNADGVQLTYIKALNTTNGDKFGESLAVNSDGTIYAVGATLENGKGTGTTATDSEVKYLQAGAVYLFQ